MNEKENLLPINQTVYKIPFFELNSKEYEDYINEKDLDTLIIIYNGLANLKHNLKEYTLEVMKDIKNRYLTSKNITSNGHILLKDIKKHSKIIHETMIRVINISGKKDCANTYGWFASKYKDKALKMYKESICMLREDIASDDTSDWHTLIYIENMMDCFATYGLRLLYKEEVNVESYNIEIPIDNFMQYFCDVKKTAKVNQNLLLNQVIVFFEKLSSYYEAL